MLNPIADGAVDRGALFLSYLLELLVLPAHAWRLMRLRLAARRRLAALKEDLRLEVAVVREVRYAARQIEQESATALLDLGLAASRTVVYSAAQAALARLRRRVAARLAPAGGAGDTSGAGRDGDRLRRGERREDGGGPP